MRLRLLLICATLLSPAVRAQGVQPDANWHTLVPDLLQQQKGIYVDYPVHLVHGKNWLPTVLIAGGVAALAATDQYDAPHFRRTTTFKSFNQALSGTNTSVAIIAAPALTYAAGLLTHDKYAQSTGFLAGEALVDSEILDEVMKLATQRARPGTLSPRANFADSFYDSKTLTDGSFPSGHTIAAFSVATVMSRRYGARHKWVPYVAYGSASLIGFSRLTLNAHYVSDVAMGAALGYVVSRFVVLRHSEQQ